MGAGRAACDMAAWTRPEKCGLYGRLGDAISLLALVSWVLALASSFVRSARADVQYFLCAPCALLLLRHVTGVAVRKLVENQLVNP